MAPKPRIKYQRQWDVEGIRRRILEARARERVGAS